MVPALDTATWSNDAIARSSFADYQWIAHFVTLETLSLVGSVDFAPGCVVRPRLVRHKKEEIEAFETKVLLKQANSDRPGFQLRLMAQGDERPVAHDSILSHSYAAMGLEMQSELQHSVLCRVYNMRVAAAMMKAISSLLALPFHQGCIRAWDNAEALDALKIECENLGVYLSTSPGIGSVKHFRESVNTVLENYLLQKFCI